MIFVMIFVIIIFIDVSNFNIELSATRQFEYVFSNDFKNEVAFWFL